ncbi:hypothetical protein VPBG_00155 [Vibrio phage helene 12B3]|uniref:hypothetical protein n=1 Tax=Vibrio phage helene 12B3 TaxID=573173 RepID=UPI0002C0C1A7|nr:hypothetical protein VPBG_00155 [Vibrio phage helene 12B3]YP_009223026.1 hypothetical protein VPLG_00177 [Vibrio phage eugene 12A10]AGG57927.1 hypothetical protein VPBG_00155 [Vibrio phage helene 12B3]AGN51616.1 hypothetical protein VPLG_00177 [Vibrio phage eugene 12A10]
MFNSKLKLQGLSLEEVIHEGVFGNNQEVSIDDWKYIEHLYQKEENIVIEEGTYTREDLDETAEVNYSQGLSDGGSDERELKRLQTILKENDIEY